MSNREEYEEYIKKLRTAEGCQKNFWYDVKTEEDIKFLLESFGGFHDSVLTAAKYTNGRWYSSGGIGMNPKQEILSLFFKNQWVNYELELKFTGIRRLNLIGLQDQYSPELFDCYLSFFDNKIVFADAAEFNPKKELSVKLIEEPMTTFVVSDMLSWRFLDS